MLNTIEEVLLLLIIQNGSPNTKKKGFMSNIPKINTTFTVGIQNG